jgi:uncharacterized protein with PIN domain
MLGRLARWLRLIGYDTVYAAGLSDHQIAAHARAEGRTVLTRDQDLMQRRGIDCIYVRSQDLEEQLEQIVTYLGYPETGVPRCAECNTPLVPAAPQEIRSRIPPYVFDTHDQFHLCTECDKVYWPGSHWKSVQQVLARLFDQKVETDDLLEDQYGK